MRFEWDPQKADGNLKKHGLSFQDAASVLGDTLSITYPDPDHSEDEHRFITVGTHNPASCLWLLTQIEEATFGLLVHERRHGKNASAMKKANDKKKSDDLRPEYDLSKLKGGVRGKYAKRFQKGTNLVLLSPDVAKYFPDEQSVNDALRSLVNIAKTGLRHAN